MNTLTDIIYAYDLLANINYAGMGRSVELFTNLVARDAVCEDPLADEPWYCLGMPGWLSRTGKDEQIKFQMPLYDKNGPDLSVLERGHMATVWELSQSIRRCTADSGHLNGILEKHGSSLDDLAASPYDLYALQCKPPMIAQGQGLLGDDWDVVDYKFVEKGAACVAFNIGEKSDLVAGVGLPEFTTDHLDLVLEMVVNRNPSIQAITTEPQTLGGAVSDEMVGHLSKSRRTASGHGHGR